MFIATATRTMQGAKRVVVDDGYQARTPRRDRLAELSRQWQAKQAAKVELPPVPPDKRIPKTEAQQVIADVASKHGVTYADIIGKSRQRKIKEARFDAIAAVYLNCRIDGRQYSLSELGRTFRRDHTSCYHSLQKRGLA